MSTETENHYRVLDLELGASLEEVKQSWRVLVKAWHPDRFTGDPKMQKAAGEKLKKINLAYEELKKTLADFDSAPPPQNASTQTPPRPQSSPRPQESRAASANDLRMVCNQCGGQVAFPEESEGATVPCPHCGINILLYRSNYTSNADSKRTYEDILREPKPKSSADEFFEGLAGGQQITPFDKTTSLTGNQWEDILVGGVLLSCFMGCILLVFNQIHGWIFDLILCALPIYLLPSYLAKRHNLRDCSLGKNLLYFLT